MLLEEIANYSRELADYIIYVVSEMLVPDLEIEVLRYEREIDRRFGRRQGSS